MSGLAGSPAIAIVGAGALLANPGGFIPIALKTISETDPSAAGYAVQWLFFTIAAVLPLTVAVIMLLVAPEPTKARARTASGPGSSATPCASPRSSSCCSPLSLLRNGISGLTS